MSAFEQRCGEVAVLGSSEAATGDERLLFFGPFGLDPTRRRLFRANEPIRLGSRAISILILLVDRAGELATREELVRAAWPETFVEEVNLRVHITAIRRALGDLSDAPRYIANVPGRGYRFLAHVTSGPVGLWDHSGDREAGRFRPPLGPPVRLLGRSDAIAAVSDMVRQSRLVTVTGPRGVGKSAVSHAVASDLAEDFTLGIGLIDLARLSDSGPLLPQLERVMKEAEIAGASRIDEAAAAGKRLIVIDNCDDLIESAAVAVEILLRRESNLHVLATSREILRVLDERVFRVQPLEVPAAGISTLAEAMSSPALTLLIERVRASNGTARFSDRDLARLTGVSRKLDGLPMAIEMAAARIGIFGLKEVESRLERNWEFFADVRRSAGPRPATLQDMLDLNQASLTVLERETVERLAIFAGGFNLREACLVSADEPSTNRSVVETLGSLVAKSHLIVTRRGAQLSYRLSRLMREHALQHLRRTPFHVLVAERHATIVLDRLGDASGMDAPQLSGEWEEPSTDLLECATEALAWCFQVGGNQGLGLEIVVASAPMLLHAGRLDTVRRYAELALGIPGVLSNEQRLRLLLQLLAICEDRPDAYMSRNDLLRQAGRLRREVGKSDTNAEYLILKAATALRFGRTRSATALCRLAKDYSHAARRPDLISGCEQLMARLLHVEGQHSQSSSTARSAMARPANEARAPVSILFPSAQASMRVIEARRLWLVGKADQARHVVFEALSFASEHGPNAVCEALSTGVCPVLLLNGDDDRALPFIERLEREAEFADLSHWRSWAELYRKVMLHITMREGRRSESRISVRSNSTLQTETWLTLTGSFNGAGRPAAVASGWCRAEMMRVNACQLHLEGRTSEAVAQLVAARTLAIKQGALAWELRIAMSLARLWRHDRESAAFDVLLSAHDQLAEGFETSDVIAAKALLRQLGIRRIKSTEADAAASNAGIE